jgi:SAM-dependent methyltransferase
MEPWYEKFGGSAAAAYERFFVPVIGEPLARELVAAAGLREGERVLDVACGTGIVARLAAERVGATGAVAGLDVSPEMLAVARAVSPPGIEFHEGAAEAHSLPDASRDVVFCQLALMFVTDRPAALQKMRRVLVPGGRLLLNVPGPTPAIFAAFAEGLARHLGPPAAGFIHAVFALHDPREVGDLVASAGFTNVQVDVARKTLRLPAPADFVSQYIQSTPLSAAVPAEKRPALERDIVALWAPFTKGDSMILDLSLTTARATA